MTSADDGSVYFLCRKDFTFSQAWLPLHLPPPKAAHS